MSNFKDLGLSDPILKVLEEIGFQSPTPIQESTIPVLSSQDKDFIGLAQTGTGKTAAFGLPILERIDDKSRDTQALILAPTRELGRQIAEQLDVFAKYLPKINVMAVYGGTNISNQISDFKRYKPQVLIATPGRLIDLIERRVINLKKINFVVLDEADEMLNMGFKEDIDKILSFTPDEKLTWLFSATMPNEIKKIVNKYMDDPLESSVNRENIVNENIEHQYVVVDGRKKNEYLMNFIDLHDDMRSIIFCRTRKGTQNLADILQRNNYKADALHGDMSQSQRDRVMKKFKDQQLQILVATDVAARGIDVNDLTHVLHHALPDDLPYYTHRSGRTARAGKKGVSLAFLGKSEVRKIKQIERQLKLKFTEVRPPRSEEILGKRMVSWAERVVAISVNKKVEDSIYEEIDMIFAGLSKEEIIRKFASEEVARLNLGNKKSGSNESESGGSGRDYNERSRRRSDRPDRGRDKRRDPRVRDRRDKRDSRGDRGDRRDRSDRRDRDRKDSGGDRRDRREKQERGSKNVDANRYFINLGRVDGMNGGELAKFVGKTGGISSEKIGNITVGDKFSFLDIDKSVPDSCISTIDGKKIGGREIRMNKDD